MKVEPKTNEMRTQTYTQVEAIVAKYKNLASEAVKEERERIGKIFEFVAATDFEAECEAKTNKVSDVEAKASSVRAGLNPGDLDRIEYMEQLIGRIYQLRMGERANEKALREYARYTQYYISGLLSAEEETFLVENFAVFLDFAFEHICLCWSLMCGGEEGLAYPEEWASLVPHLLENRDGKMFIPYSHNGSEFAGLSNCDLLVGRGFANAAMRAQAYGLSIEEYGKEDSAQPLFGDLADGTFDAVIVNITGDNMEECFHACNRIVKNGGEIFLCLPKESILDGSASFLYQHVVEEKDLKEAIMLPSDEVLFHLVKKSHDTFIACDATALKLKCDDSKVDVEALCKLTGKAAMFDEATSREVRSFRYEKLCHGMLLPSYYLHFTEGTELGQLVQVCTNLIMSDECSGRDKVVTINQLSKTFSKGEFHVDALPSLNTDRLRSYYRVEGPAVIVAVSKSEMAVGYTLDKSSFLVPRNLYALKPASSLDTRFLASQMLNQVMLRQMRNLVYGKGVKARLTSRWLELIRLDVPAMEKQQKLIQETMLANFADQEKLMATRELSFRHSIRLRKHALSQNISAFDSLFGSLEYCMRQHNGRLNSKDQISPISTMTVGEAMDILHSKLKTICQRVAQLTDDQNWGPCEAIEPQQFIEEYEQSHRSADFKYTHCWEPFETNCFKEDVYEKGTGKLLFHKGETLNAAWFPKRALQQVLDNIVSNARAHGFTDKSRADYTIQTSWTTDGLSMIINVSNNGKPMPAGTSSDLVLEYGYSSSLNQRGHGGIGGGEIADIMHRFGGNVSVVSSPEKKFTVAYVLSLPLASLY